MSNILPFPARPTPKEQDAKVEKSQYYCGRCNAAHFKLYPEGHVHCAECDIRLGNLLVGQVRMPPAAR